MKRFFCTTCNSIRRVRSLPSNVSDSYSAAVEDRRGTCNYHRGGSRAKANDRVRHVHGLGSTRRTSASSAKSKSKRG